MILAQLVQLCQVLMNLLINDAGVVLGQSGRTVAHKLVNRKNISFMPYNPGSFTQKQAKN